MVIRPARELARVRMEHVSHVRAQLPKYQQVSRFAHIAKSIPTGSSMPLRFRGVVMLSAERHRGCDGQLLLKRFMAASTLCCLARLRCIFAQWTRSMSAGLTRLAHMCGISPANSYASRWAASLSKLLASFSGFLSLSLSNLPLLAVSWNGIFHHMGPAL